MLASINRPVQLQDQIPLSGRQCSLCSGISMELFGMSYPNLVKHSWKLLLTTIDQFEQHYFGKTP